MEKKRQSTSTSLGKECVSFWCSNRNYNPDGSPSSFSFFKFPTKNPSRNVWCNLVKRQHGRDGFKVTENTVICDQHFKESDIHRPPGGSRRRLKKGNVYLDKCAVFNCTSVKLLLVSSIDHEHVHYSFFF